MNIVTLKADGLSFGVNKLQDGSFEVFGPDKKSYVGDRRMAAKKLGDFIFEEVDRIEYLKSLRPNQKPLEEAIVPYMDGLREQAREHGDWILGMGPQACGCMGPQRDDPLCPCAMMQEARVRVAAERGYRLPG